MSKSTYPQKKIIIILGSTASGKSDLAVDLAKKFNGEVISADSRQVYRGMNIGTGKVSRDKLSKLTISDIVSMPETAYTHKDIAHYLLDVANPKRRFTVAQYKKLANKAIEDILRRGKIPIICGGTGFYIDALLGSATIPEVKPDWHLRARLEKKSTEELFGELKKLDPHRAKNIDCFNRRRLIRALEIIYKTGRPVPPIVISEKTEIQKYEALYIGLKKSPAELKKLIAKRLLKRLGQGMIAEVKKLRRQGLSWKKLEDFGLEYRWIALYLQKKISRQARGKSAYQEMISRLQRDIEHYAKRQMTWFRRNDKIKWPKNKTEASRLCSKFINLALL